MNRLSFIWLALLSSMLAHMSSSAFAQTDSAREARWRAEVEPSLVVGDAHTLTTATGQPFFSIFTVCGVPAATATSQLLPPQMEDGTS